MSFYNNFFVVAEMAFTLVIHHSGTFSMVRHLHYIETDKDAIYNQDVDTWSYFEAVVVVHELGYPKENFKLWWKKNDECFEDGLKLIIEDQQTLELAKYAIDHNVEVHMYVQHIPHAEVEILEHMGWGNDGQDVGGNAEMVDGDGVVSDVDMQHLANEGSIDQGDVHAVDDHVVGAVDVVENGEVHDQKVVVDEDVADQGDVLIVDDHVVGVVDVAKKGEVHD